MNILAKNIKWIMLISGLFTCSMIYVVIAPEAALKSMFGASVNGPLANIVARDWGFLITLVGVMLIYGAFRPVHRQLIIVFACVGKAMFIGLVLTLGRMYLHDAWFAISFDSIVILVLLASLAGSRGQLK